MPSTGAPSVIEAVRRATKSQHEELASHAAMARLFSANYRVEEYRTHIGRLLGLYEPIERAFVRAGSEHAFNLHLRVSALRRDLFRMGATAEEVGELERRRPFPALTASGLLGYGYVLFGSMLGARVIVARLREVLGVKVSYCFYGADGVQTGELWESYCRSLERAGDVSATEISASAVEMFDAYAEWLSGNGKRARFLA
jgi:heme oxygenase